MKLKTTMGVCDMCVDVDLKQEHSINYLVFEFFQLTDTAGITSVTINSPTKKEILELAKNLRKLGNTLSS